MKKYKFLLCFLFTVQVFFLYGQNQPQCQPCQPYDTAITNNMPRSGGYLLASELPDGTDPNILPPPPDTGSFAFKQDQYLATQVYSHASQARKDQAREDAYNYLPFDSTLLGIDVSFANTPILFNLIMRSALMDAGNSVTPAKEFYNRKRPFMYNYNYTCTPEEEKDLRENASYPSGHSAFGWAAALVLTEIFPDKTDRILARGNDFGRSRNICNCHWTSDVVAGQRMATMTVARLHANPEFLKDLEKAKAEVEELLKKQK